MKRPLQRRHAAGVDRRHRGGALRLRQRVVSKLGYVGIPTALSLATPKPRRKKARRPVAAVSLPVFYDKSGKRLRRLVMAGCALLLALGIVAANMIPAILAPAHRLVTLAANSDDGFPRRYLGDLSHLPAVGGGVMTRMVTVVREHTDRGAIPGPAPALLEPIPPPDDDGDGIPDDVDGDGIPDQPQPPKLPDPPPLSPVKLVDAVTGDFIRYATEEEAGAIGDSAYAIDHFGQVPDHTLILTFDDGPDATFTPEILNILAREHVPATFFVVGQSVVDNPDILNRIIREGHMVGNHTWSHPHFDDQTDFRGHEELIGTDHIIRQRPTTTPGSSACPTATPTTTRWRN